MKLNFEDIRPLEYDTVQTGIIVNDVSNKLCVSIFRVILFLHYPEHIGRKLLEKFNVPIHTVS